MKARLREHDNLQNRQFRRQEEVKGSRGKMIWAGRSGKREREEGGSVQFIQRHIGDGWEGSAETGHTS